MEFSKNYLASLGHKKYNAEFTYNTLFPNENKKKHIEHQMIVILN